MDPKPKQQATFTFPAQLLDEFQPECLIGEGGFGVVYRAQQLSLGRTVALKLVHPRHSYDPVFRDRFIHEAKMMVRITHPAVVPILDHGSFENLVYLVLPYIPGPSLQQLMENGPLPWQEAARHARRIAEGLDAIHAVQVVHRDLKPSNVLMDELGDALVTDFGLSKPAGLRAQTRTGVLMGTPGYVAPERIEGNPEIANSDLFSLGVILWEMMVGWRPFQKMNGNRSTGTGSPVQELVSAATGKIPPFPTNGQDVPPQLVNLTRRLLSADPGARAKNAAQVVEEIDWILTEATPSVQHTRPVQVPATRPARVVRAKKGAHLPHTPHLRLLSSPGRPRKVGRRVFLLALLVAMCCPLLLHIRLANRPLPEPVPIRAAGYKHGVPAPKASRAANPIIQEIGAARELCRRLAVHTRLPLKRLQTSANGEYQCPLVLTSSAQLATVKLDLAPGCTLMSVNRVPCKVAARAPIPATAGLRVGLNWLEIQSTRGGDACGFVQVGTPFSEKEVRPVASKEDGQLRDRVLLESGMVLDWGADSVARARDVLTHSTPFRPAPEVDLMRTVIDTYIAAQLTRVSDIEDLNSVFNPYYGQGWKTPELARLGVSTLRAAVTVLLRSPTSWEAWHDIGWALCHLGHREMGNLALCQALTYCPDSHWSWWELSVSEYLAWQDGVNVPGVQNEHRAEAISCLERAWRCMRRQSFVSQTTPIESTMTSARRVLLSTINLHTQKPDPRSE